MVLYKNFPGAQFNFLGARIASAGLYLDGVSYDFRTMRRVRKVLDAARPGGRGLLDLHGGNLFDLPQTDCCHGAQPHVPSCDALGAVCKGSWSGATSAALTYMDLFPYLDSTMFGEWFNVSPYFLWNTILLQLVRWAMGTDGRHYVC
jgi:hypothetical protein